MAEEAGCTRSTKNSYKPTTTRPYQVERGVGGPLPHRKRMDGNLCCRLPAEVN